jgi:mycothiol synthase
MHDDDPVRQVPDDAPVSMEVLTRLDDSDVAALGMLVERVTEADGVRPLDEHVMLHLRYGGDYDVRHVLAWADHDGERALVGYGHLDVTDVVAGSSAELAVHPAYRRHGIGRELVQQLVAETPDGRLRLWAHGEHAAASSLAASLGFDRTRVLYQLRRSLYAPLPDTRLPAGVGLRSFRPGVDDDAWVDLNARAFADLPDQGSWTLADLHLRMREPWFDATGFLVAEREADGGARMVGFHWTKVHGGLGPGELWHDHDGEGHHRHDVHGHEPMGEVYVVGVDADEQGHGLGRALTIAGLAHLRAAGLPEAMLYVDAGNAPALAVYESLGFARWDTDVMFTRSADRVAADPARPSS